MFRSLLFVLLVATIYVLVDAEVELYSDKYDYINADEILNNDRLREQYYECFMDTGPCLTADAKFFKGNFPESIVTKCAKCTEKQKAMFGKTVEWYTTNQEEKWKTLLAKFLEDAKKMKIAADTA
nr:chemosensory protein 4 [Gregopimpla kuwanae]